MRRRTAVALVGGMSLAAGCAYDPTVLDAGYTRTYEVPAVRVMQPQGPKFNRGLRTGYLDLASDMGGELADQWHFEFKAVDAGKGQLLLPDAVESRWLAADRAEELAAAQADLTPVTQAVLEQVAADYARDRPTRVIIAGHADRSGTKAYNEGLSEQRAGNGARALVARGVPQAALDVQWSGEIRPRIATPDGVREPQNRRVEIVFGEGPWV